MGIGGTDQHTSTVILARVSSKSQEDEGYSLDSQIKLLGGYCANKDLVVVKVFKIAETASKEQSRRIFRELLEYIKANDVYHLAVEKTDRLTRNLRDAVAIDDWLEQDGNRMLHAVKENLLLHKEARSDVKFMWNIHLAVAKKYTDNLREEAMKGWAEKLAQGWLPSTPPPGYMTTAVNGKRIHVPDPNTRSLMLQVFKKYLEPSQSIASIAEEMKKMGLRTRPGRPYSSSHVQQILTNPFYIGINRFNGKDYPGAQEPIISRELFERVQKKMHRGRPAVLKKHDPVFKNLIDCSDCGGVVTWQLQKGRYYGACQRAKSGCTRKKFIREDRVEVAIIEMLKQLVSPSKRVLGWVADEMSNEFTSSVENRDKLVASIRLQIVRVKRMDNELYDDKLAGDISKEKYQEKHQAFKEQLSELEKQLKNAEMPSQVRLDQRIVLFELSQKAAQIYEKGTPEQKRLIITKLFSKLTCQEDALSVSYTKFAKAIANRSELSRILIGGRI